MICEFMNRTYIFVIEIWVCMKGHRYMKSVRELQQNRICASLSLSLSLSLASGSVFKLIYAAWSKIPLKWDSVQQPDTLIHLAETKNSDSRDTHTSSVTIYNTKTLYVFSHTHISSVTIYNNKDPHISYRD